ncbi:DUF6143 family protein [Bacillus carboniphilus]|uniref:DUF6143 family protein n=1 Tax=Bacillus carboniphilus TaxID=86663 RepID=A0ABY9JY77_9BACI|nr:DUF6143 family protein [Bacillus carboniphilus]WLR42545.1 DUF6143 family protein [Bacillus carboniphilus]
MEKFKSVITTPDVRVQAEEGRLFSGSTEILQFGNSTSAWGRLCNPKQSTVNLFIDVFTISNFSDNPFTANLYRNSLPPGDRLKSSDVGNANFGSINSPEGVIQYNPSVNGVPSGGTRVIPRRVPSNETIADSIDGKAILPPGTSLLIFLTSDTLVKGEIQFAWWENRDITCY